jgi:CheY-like chemotaxis protein
VDEPSLERVLSNLLVNALAATPPGGAIQVQTRVRENRPQEVEIIVADTGCGLSPEEQEHLFEKFRLAPHRAGSSGLGLYICKTLVEANQGRIWVESQVGEGSRFHLAFPTAAGEILVVDDDPGTREALTAILDRAGYRTLSLAGEEEEMAALCGQHNFRVAVVDYHLPSRDGLEVARLLKQCQPECRIILISADLPQLNSLADSQALVDRFLTKPFSKDVILEAIAQLCSPPPP